MSNSNSNNAERTSWFRTAFPKIILLLPYIALLWIPFYNDVKPALFGFPFFYWYQFLWVPLTSLIILIAYKVGK
jgi:hypothetical protein